MEYRPNWSTVKPLDPYRNNIHSSNGEDGVILEIMRRIAAKFDFERWCVEFGAWDGVTGSNTFALVQELGYRAVMIEGRKDRFDELLVTAKQYPAIIPLRAYVSPKRNDETSLDRLFAQTEIPREFAVLSIDIDSNDLDVWESLSNYLPLLVVIEINSSIPPGVVWRHSGKTPGNTFTATCNVAREKGYSLVCHTGNLIFVRDDLLGAINLEQRYITYPELLFDFNNPWMQTHRFLNLTASASRRQVARKIISRFLPSWAVAGVKAVSRRSLRNLGAIRTPVRLTTNHISESSETKSHGL